MEGVAQVRVLAADFGAARGQLGVDERARERDCAAREPSAEYEEGRVNLPRDDRGVDEDAGADDAAHHDHRRVEQTQTPRETEVRGVSVLPSCILARVSHRAIQTRMDRIYGIKKITVLVGLDERANQVDD